MTTTRTPHDTRFLLRLYGPKWSCESYREGRNGKWWLLMAGEKVFQIYRSKYGGPDFISFTTCDGWKSFEYKIHI